MIVDMESGYNNRTDFFLSVLKGVKNWQSRLWKLVHHLTDFANSETTQWPSPDQPDHLANDVKFMREYKRVIEQVLRFYLLIHESVGIMTVL